MLLWAQTAAETGQERGLRWKLGAVRCLISRLIANAFDPPEYGSARWTRGRQRAAEGGLRGGLLGPLHFPLTGKEQVGRGGRIGAPLPSSELRRHIGRSAIVAAAMRPEPTEMRPAPTEMRSFSAEMLPRTLAIRTLFVRNASCKSELRRRVDRIAPFLFRNAFVGRRSISDETAEMLFSSSAVTAELRRRIAALALGAAPGTRCSPPSYYLLGTLFRCHGPS